MLENLTSFNYIITIHNKEELIRNVMISVIQTAGPESHIYPVLDGCTDSSEFIIDELIELYPENKITKLFANDVHELKSINIGLESANQNGAGYNIILQDDVILQDLTLEETCIHLYNRFDHLGIVSFRHGGNLSRELIYDESILTPFQDYIQNECGHFPSSKPILSIGHFVFREIAIKSPICIPFKIVRDLGIPDEDYAPWHDIAYCYKISEAGYRNGVIAINYLSDVYWGSTRTKIQKFDVDQVETKNLALFRIQNPNILPLDTKKYPNKQYVIFEL